MEKWGSEHGKVIDVLLELHLGAEETKGGFTEAEIEEILVPLNAAEVLAENDTIRTIKITIPDGLLDINR